MFRIDAQSPVPLHEQIYRQIVFAVTTGAFPPGSRLPSVRELASQLVVNPNTVAKVFRDLERDGILDARRGLGMFVANGSERRCESIRRESVRKTFRDAAALAGQAGLDAGEAKRISAKEIDAELGRRKG